MKFLRILLLLFLSVLLVTENQALKKQYNPYLGASSVVQSSAKTDERVRVISKQGGVKYHKNIRDKALKDPVNHNFPYSFDEMILKTKPTIVRGGGKGYTLRGTQNGKDVIYNIIEKDGVIVHRDVIDVKQWSQRSKKFGWPINLEDISKDAK